MKLKTLTLNEDYRNQKGNINSEFRTLKFDRLLVATEKGYKFIEINKLVCLIANGNYTHFYVDNENDFLVSRPIGDFESILTPFGFYRIHHSHIINFQYLKFFNKIENEVLMFNGKKLLVSARKRSGFLKYCYQLSIQY